MAVFTLTGTGLVQMLEPTPYHASNPTREDFTRPHFNTGVPVSVAEKSLPMCTSGSRSAPTISLPLPAAGR